MAKVKILKDGETDITSTDIWRFAYHSDYPTYKIGASGSSAFTIASGANEGHHDVTHSLGYDPIFFAYIKHGGSVTYAVTGDFFPDIQVNVSPSGTEDIRFYTTLTDTNTLRIGAYTALGSNVSSTENFTAYWLIMLDEF
jgi:hypothetical protein